MQHPHPMNCRVPAPIESEEPPEYAELLERLGRFYGYVPNSLRIMSRNPAMVESFLAFGNQAWRGRELVDVRLKYLVVGVVSGAAGCRYCQSHTLEHGADEGVPIAKIEALWEFESSDLFDDAERAALRLARAAGVTPNEVTDAHFEELRRHFDDDQILELVSVIALFGFMNRWNDTLAVPLEDRPLTFASEHLAAGGWEPGRHVR